MIEVVNRDKLGFSPEGLQDTYRSHGQRTGS